MRKPRNLHLPVRLFNGRSYEGDLCKTEYSYRRQAKLLQIGAVAWPAGTSEEDIDTAVIRLAAVPGILRTTRKLWENPGEPLTGKGSQPARYEDPDWPLKFREDRILVYGLCEIDEYNNIIVRDRTGKERHAMTEAEIEAITARLRNIDRVQIIVNQAGRLSYEQLCDLLQRLETMALTYKD